MDLKLIYFQMSSHLLCLCSLLTRYAHRYSGTLEREVHTPTHACKGICPLYMLSPERLEQKVLALNVISPKSADGTMLDVFCPLFYSIRDPL